MSTTMLPADLRPDAPKPSFVLHISDCLALLPTLADNSVDAVVTDPPYHLTSIVKRFGAAFAAPAKSKQTGAFFRASKGFMGQTWDGGDIAFRVELWAEVLRVLKPGGHCAAFSGTRTYHRMAVAIEDAGFEIRDQLAWTYGSGFPKSHDVSKGIDKAAGAEREVQSTRTVAIDRWTEEGRQRLAAGETGSYPVNITAPATPEAAQWQGWGTALKPAWEPICLARKPLSGKTVAENVLAHGVGALNVDGCRVEGDDVPAGRSRHGGGLMQGHSFQMPDSVSCMPAGRWPANIIHDGEAGFSEQGRFFYCAKASKADRGEGNIHPTVKPTELMRWLCRLVTPPGGIVLDPFTGSGSTGRGAVLEGFSFVGVEMSPDYAAIAQRRIEAALAGDVPAAKQPAPANDNVPSPAPGRAADLFSVSA